MTVYGIDIASYQTGINLAEVKAEGFTFVIAKVTQGSSYVDPAWPAFRDGAGANGLTLVGYHYVTLDQPAAQAQNLIRHLGHSSIPLMLDFEAGSGDLHNFWAVAGAITAAGGHIALSYIPRWYWRRIGSPDLSGVAGLVASDYVGGTGYASALYPGGQSSLWAGYGGAEPVILQFTDAALVAGYTVDADAYRGTDDQLRQLLAAEDPVTSKQRQNRLVSSSPITIPNKKWTSEVRYDTAQVGRGLRKPLRRSSESPGASPRPRILLVEPVLPVRPLHKVVDSQLVPTSTALRSTLAESPSYCVVPSVGVESARSVGDASGQRFS